MELRRILSVGLAVALLSTGCVQPVARVELACDPDDLSSAIVLAAQSVPGTSHAPCITQLNVGWSYEDLIGEAGRSRFWLSSDRVGERFVEVSMTATCDLGDAVPVTTDEPGIDRYERVERADVGQPVVIVPEGHEELSRRYAETIAGEVEGEVLAGRRLEVTVATGAGTTSERVASALAADAPVIVADVRGEEEGTVELQVPDGAGAAAAVDRSLPLAVALERIEQRLDEPRYQATWYYVFDGGCVTYEFDAHGASVSTVTTDVERALGFVSLAAGRERARELGYVVP